MEKINTQIVSFHLSCGNPPLGCLGMKSNAKINTDNIGCLFDSKTLQFANIQPQSGKKQKFCSKYIIKAPSPSSIGCSAVRACLAYVYIKTPVAIKRLLCLSFTRDERWGGFLKQIFFKN